MAIEEIRQFLMPVMIILAFVVGGYLLSIWLNVYVTRFARKTKTKVDDIIVDAVKLPIVIVFFVIGARLLTEVAFRTIENVEIDVGDRPEAAALDQNGLLVEDLGGLQDLAVGGEHGSPGHAEFDQPKAHDPIVYVLEGRA